MPPMRRRQRPVRTALVRREDIELPDGFRLPDRQLEVAKRYLNAARSTNTRIARRSDWQVFTEWCEANGQQAIPSRADTVFSFLLDQVNLLNKKPATLARYIASLATAHGGAGHPDPTKDKRIAELMDGVRRTHGVRQRQAAPMTHEILEAIRPHCSPRDWAVVCFGQGLAARRSELCALDLVDIKIDERGAAVTFQKSKTDQEGKGAVIGVHRRSDDPLCPVAALEAYLRSSSQRRIGPVFTGARTTRLTAMEVHRTVKRVVSAAGLDPSLYSGHSMRAGYVTDARRAGKSWLSIMAHTRHADLKTVRGYARYKVDPFEVPRDEH